MPITVDANDALNRDLEGRYLLANEEHVDRAKIKVVEEGECSKPVVGRVLSCVELRIQVRLCLERRIDKLVP